MTKIKQLERELNQKIHELNENLNVQNMLRETLEGNIKTLGRVEKQLKDIEAYVKCSNNSIDKLKQENRSLKLSCDEWMKRAIKLEFKVLSALDAIKKQQMIGGIKSQKQIRGLGAQFNNASFFL